VGGLNHFVGGLNRFVGGLNQFWAVEAEA